MDADYQIDLGEVRRHLEHTQVVGFFFPFFRRTLLLDLRTNDTSPPMVTVVPMVNSVEDRVRSLKRLRPRFPRPESMMLVPWPRYVGSMQRLGVWEMIEERLVAIGGDSMRNRCREVLAELMQAELVQVRNAITGEGYQTLWERE
ncbi:MAG: hypothetical protein ACYDCQ_08285 [Dehalococcoidia bacterium]